MLIELNLIQSFSRIVGVHHRQIDWFSQLLTAAGNTGGKLPPVYSGRNLPRCRSYPASSPCDAAMRKDRPQPAMPLWQRQEIQEVLFAIAVHSAGPQGASIGDGEIDQSSKGLGRSLRRVIM
jgi:hypothetical protein